MVVIDSNIFAKLFIEEPDSVQAKAFFKYCLENNTPLLAPTLFTYEVLQIAVYYNHPLENALQRIEDFSAFNLELAELDRGEWLRVEKMTASGHEKSGNPAVYDSSYHCLAIARGQVFLTADKRHEAKTRQFGNIKLLAQWPDIFENSGFPRSRE